MRTRGTGCLFVSHSRHQQGGGRALLPSVDAIDKTNRLSLSLFSHQNRSANRTLGPLPGRLGTLLGIAIRLQMSSGT